ncbi:hypothetical protein QUG02_06490 [Bacillus hominis]|uniref:Lipoprotein n=1 Tax=Bacillus hominis TaxID=2817478 RepID=A0ABT7R5Z6_9BACI|nr:hypothetical protein [Bacillus hominis]MDM5192621.1 hypothetical protein [Bacillus hominis]MDM5432347.1 hypothetical protein [Bacillus hominis]MDM5437786.1 hypothetical protein [Bacillus hominis]
MLVGCSSNSTSDDAENIDKGSIVVAIQEVVKQNEGIDNVDWPWDYDDYNIVDNGDNTYDTSGQFTWQDKIYNFNITVEDTGSTIKILNYNVY